MSAPLESIFVCLEKLKKLFFLESDLESTPWGGYGNKEHQRLFRRDVPLKWPTRILHYFIADNIGKLFTIWIPCFITSIYLRYQFVLIISVFKGIDY